MSINQSEETFAGEVQVAELIRNYMRVRRKTISLCDNLQIEDYSLQAMSEVSPPKWHLAHTTWFFETFILVPFVRGYRVHNPFFEYLFNSYYNSVGKQYPRPQRGLLSRPTLAEVMDYREHVDTAMEALLQLCAHPDRVEILKRFELGINHEQQHQELICTDIKYSFSMNPLYPYLQNKDTWGKTLSPSDLQFVEFDKEIANIGHYGAEFHFDNETPLHNFYIAPFKFANRLITNAEFAAFIEAGSYQNPLLWLADGWIWKQESHSVCPLYWRKLDGEWHEFTLYGLKPLDPNLPVSHVNYFEADAYARWCGVRLATEQEWEHVSKKLNINVNGNDDVYHPMQQEQNTRISQMFGTVWQWTRSSYSPYPGYQADDGAIGEYNGKFMCNQMVLRGSSCVTAVGHARRTYRNFFYPMDRWQFSGIRLAKDIT